MHRKRSLFLKKQKVTLRQRKSGSASSVLDNLLKIWVYRSVVSVFCRLSVSLQSLNITNKNWLVKVCNKITGTVQETLQDSCNRTVRDKADSSLSNSSYPVHEQFELFSSASFFRPLPIKTIRYKRSFIPTAIFLLNSDRKLLLLHSV